MAEAQKWYVSRVARWLPCDQAFGSHALVHLQSGHSQLFCIFHLFIFIFLRQSWASQMAQYLEVLADELNGWS